MWAEKKNIPDYKASHSVRRQCLQSPPWEFTALSYSDLEYDCLSQGTQLRKLRKNIHVLKNKNQQDATSCFIILTICSTYFGHFYAHHPELTTIVLITTWAVRAAGYSLQPGHLSSLPAPNFQPTATQEPDGPCGNQHYSRELLMMGIKVPEICWANHKYNKTRSNI